MERVHPQARFDQSGRRAHVVHAAPMCGSPRPTSGHSRGPALIARAPLLPPGSSTNSTRLSRHRAAQRCCTGALRCSRRRSPAFRGCLTTLGCCFEPSLASLKRIDWPPSPGTRPVARRRLPLPNRPAAFCCRVQPPGMLSPPRLPIDHRSGRSCRVATTPHLLAKDPQRRCRPRVGAARALLSATAVVLPNARRRLPANVHCLPAQRTLAPPANRRQQSVSPCDSHGNAPQNPVRTRRTRTVTAA